MNKPRRETGMNKPNRTMGSDGLLFSRIWFSSRSGYHRHNGPAFEMSDGRKEWYVMGEFSAWQPVNSLPPLTDYDMDGSALAIEKFPGYAPCEDEP
jgi:hypothetical protein